MPVRNVRYYSSCVGAANTVGIVVLLGVFAVVFLSLNGTVDLSKKKTTSKATPVEEPEQSSPSLSEKFSFQAYLKQGSSPKSIVKKKHNTEAPVKSALVWPPTIGKKYPDLKLPDASGHIFSLSSLRGRVVLVEFVAMNSPASQALSGGHYRGGYYGIKPQSGIASIIEYFSRFSGGATLGDDRVALVQIFLYDLNSDIPTQEDVLNWTNHFGNNGARNHYILIGTKEIRGGKTSNLVPGFHLLDKNLVLRASSTGAKPQDNLYTKLLPMAGKLLKTTLKATR